MKIFFWIGSFIEIMESIELEKGKIDTGKRAYKWFVGGWLIYWGLFFLLAGDFGNMLHKIGIIVYLFLLYHYWKVCRLP